ncbi:MAG: cobalamin biosynthesis protein CbiX [Gammaproteobacteria bacterium]|jgi:sirohydrochlorin ferrochelatase|nr:cobalamin biosynthesis protein CbiX [Gammaproteobacteria bacterium]MBT3724434.1 cobalamin biosynthesis protein CbiX [Gammaproteobacteria bacterium]MBT4075398.1 cobalamin biosynthesis protein CbiX [Gammaproteobacteria bacterium]MBT4195604.1 cobalamin biosynthesis protein CbiX [Gammaproteobacteria bacterium]MBT4450563.1 cobalamin biosynthesis protein CbiX [Gammaproteobacteria bacterium]
MRSDVTIMLVDNGSVKPEATLQLRRLAESLGNNCEQKVFPVSLRHANRINSDFLNGKPASTLVPFLSERLKAGFNQFILIPLFFTESGALTSFVPEQLELLERQFGKIDLTVTDVIYPLPEGDNRLVNILFDHVLQQIRNDTSVKHNIVLVDHGSPSQKVSAVRQHVAAALQSKFNDVVIEQAVMERREGEQYDFNGPLLDQWLEQKATHGELSAIVVLMFFLPGSHAGDGGDIENICHGIKQQHPDFNIYITPLVAENAGLIDILLCRVLAASSLLN